MIGFPYESPHARKWGLAPLEENANICGIIDNVSYEYTYKGVNKSHKVYPKSKLVSLFNNNNIVFIIANPQYTYLKDEIISWLNISSENIFCFDVPTVCVHGNQYFEDSLIKLNENEVFFDAGAYDFDVAIEFLKHTNGSYKKIYAAEPLEELYKKCLEIVKHGDYKNVVVENVGLWNCNGKLKFSLQEDGSSCIRSEGDEIIETKTIDNIVDGEEVTIIKMDIEGAEYEAINGARETIKKYKPLLMICVYHKPNDTIRLYKQVKSLVPEYKLILRHYSFSEYETVLYFFPEDRLLKNK